MRLTRGESGLSRRQFLGVGVVAASALLIPRGLAHADENSSTIVRQRDLWAMGGWNRLSVEAESRAVAAIALEAMMAAIRSIDQTFSVFDPRTDLARANWSALSNVPVDSPLLLDAIAASLEVASATNGLFDPTVEPLMRRWGFRDDPSQKVTRPGEMRRDWDYRSVGCDRRNARLLRESTRIQLDPGGWAKGLAAQRAAVSALGVGAIRTTVNCGGDIYWADRASDAIHECAIRDPLRGRTDIALRVRHRFAAAATSGNVESFRHTVDGARIGHLMDPRTSQTAVTDLLSVTVFGDDGLAVDATASALYVMGEQDALSWLSLNPQYAAVLISHRWPANDAISVVGRLETSPT